MGQLSLIVKHYAITGILLLAGISAKAFLIGQRKPKQRRRRGDSAC